MRKFFLGFFLFLMFVFVVVTPALALGAPGNFNVVASPGDKVSLSWDGAAGAAGYNVYRKAVGKAADFNRLNLSPTNALSYEDRDVVRGKNYEYYVKAIDSDGIESAPSVIGSAPDMSLRTVVTVNHPGDKPVEIKSIATGQPVTMAAPGDILQYKSLCHSLI
jgi:fibronectin type 3 domain-containing protein